VDSYDVIVIGSGAGGGTLVHHLTSSGKRILLLERGDWLPREPQNWLAEDVFIDNRYVSEDIWYDADGKPARWPGAPSGPPPARHAPCTAVRPACSWEHPDGR
jgi:choline dehydrogenase-like flavoprotein